MKRCAAISMMVLGVAMTWVSPVAAQDVIGFWNERTLAAVSQAAPAGRGPTPAVIIDIAMVHLAMHDAVQSYDHHFDHYAGFFTSSHGSPVVAAAKAAHDILVSRFPAQQGGPTGLDAQYASFLGSLVPPPSPEDVTNGEIAGATAAANVIAARAGDGSFPSTFTQFTGGTGPGEWQPNTGTPGMVSPWAGDVRPFALDSLQRCKADPPPPLTSFEYTLNYVEVKLLGSATSKFRTPEQSALARMYSGNFLAQYNRLFREISVTHLTGSGLVRLGRQARLFALTNMAMADAFICAWSTKVEFNFWRPSEAIRRGDEDGNFFTKADPTWTTYFSRDVNAAQNPNYPDYTSGANNLTGAMTRMLEQIFRSDKLRSFGIWAANPAVPLEPGDANPRMYKRLSDVAHDVVNARIYLGIHFRFADTEARSQGRRVAGYAFRNFLEPTSKGHGHSHD
jgi:hypothetical protein